MEIIIIKFCDNFGEILCINTNKREMICIYQQKKEKELISQSKSLRFEKKNFLL